ncbi:MAG: YggT family protein [Gammaproteobacteria bacterium]|uniref:YggT family protein n=1 Tax=Pseudomaricurvus alcaniphilus TaxID=1166482 RepID=UPI00140B5D12|nr:YggT family protein [Pseudomaricurvus alcaniphilus]MBR9909864.1 YggT family protein [Gammaproteobacteria bacterium]NHN38590.1 YggT family protein [Pseudomaricurvus alcaniphilus]
MGPMQEIGTLLIQTVGSLYLFIIVLRFLLQLARADFYNPISQFAVKATNPLLIPLRRMIPGVFGIDIASLVLALALQFVVIEVSAMIIGYAFINPLSVVVWSLIGLLSMTTTIFFWGLLVVVISSWIAPHSNNPALLLTRQLVEPVMAPFRKLMPDMGGIDISPIFAFLALNVVQVLIKHLAGAAGMSPAVRSLVMGI